MTRFLLKPDQKIVVHERRMIFEFDVHRANEAREYKGCLQIPLRNEDGSYSGADTMRGIDLELGEALTIPIKGWMGTPDGDVEITVAHDDGETMRVEVSVPRRWRVVSAETFYDDSYTGS